MPENQLFDVKQIAEFLRVSPYTVRSWIRQQLLRATKLGRLVRVERRELERFIQESRV